jgi:hypothetical protein
MQTIQWITNAYGVTTCHKNDVRLSYEESRLATINFDVDANKWRYRLKGADNEGSWTGGFDTQPLVMRAVERAVNGHQVQEVPR